MADPWSMNARVQERRREPRLDAGLIDVAGSIVRDAISVEDLNF